MNFAKFLRAPLLQNTSGRLLLSIITPEANNDAVSIEPPNEVPKKKDKK